MPLIVLIALIVGITAAVYFVLRPLKVLSQREFLISHAFIVIGLLLILGWLWFNRSQFGDVVMLMGGIWTVFGGLCFAGVYALRRLKSK